MSILRDSRGRTFFDYKHQAYAALSNVAGVRDFAGHLPKMAEFMDRPIESSALFLFGGEAETLKCIRTVAADLARVAGCEVKSPFDDIVIARMVKGTWIFDRAIIDTCGFFREEAADAVRAAQSGTALSVNESDADSRSVVMKRGGQLQSILIVSDNGDGHEIPEVSLVHYSGASDGRLGICAAGSLQVTEMIKRGFSRQAVAEYSNQTVAHYNQLLSMVISISHPMSYIIKVSPDLTDREKRAAERGRGTPLVKAPYFIAVDHDILIEMRDGKTDLHSQKAPHHRRGHFRRLPERCWVAKGSGRTLTWVRPALVGKTTWEDEKNSYVVLPPRKDDFLCDEG